MLKILLHILICLLFSNPLFSQFLSGNMGIDLVPITELDLYDVNSNSSTNFPVWEMDTDKVTALSLIGRIGYDRKLVKLKDELTLGAHVSAGLGFLMSNKFNNSVHWIADFPMYFTIRHGNLSSLDSKKEKGYAFGIGYRYTWWTYPIYSPSIMLEYSKKFTSIRLHANLLKTTYYAYFTSEGLVPFLTAQPFGITISQIF